MKRGNKYRVVKDQLDKDENNKTDNISMAPTNMATKKSEHHSIYEFGTPFPPNH